MHRPTVVAALFLALLCWAAPTSAAAPKAPPPDVGNGRIAWFDIATPDLAKSKAFYESLFGWTFGPVMGSSQAFEIQVDGKGIGTLRGADGQISPWNGVVYVQVEDLPGLCAKAKELGGMVPPGFPFDLPDGTGAIALVADPAGHPIGMYSRALLPKKDPAAK